MNGQQKAQIEKYRRAGMGFVEISYRLGISVSTIKSYCYKHSVQDMTAESDVPLCPQCGQPVPQMRFSPGGFARIPVVPNTGTSILTR